MRLLKAFGSECSTASWAVMDRLRELFACHWLDHWGKATWRCQSVFVAEPYHLTAADVLEIDTIARTIGCEWEIDSNSWHFPGETIRLVFHEKETERKP